VSLQFHSANKLQSIKKIESIDDSGEEKIMKTKESIRVFLADDHPLLRTGLRLSLNHKEDIEFIGEAEDGYSAIEKIQAYQPDVSLIDVDMPRLSGIGVIRILRKSFPQMKFIVLSTYNDENYIQKAMEAGADGYVLKCVGINELVKIIKSIWFEKPVISPFLVSLTFGYTNIGQEEQKRIDAYLTQREKEVLQLIAEGKGNKEIADLLYISTETVKSHVKNIFKKFGVKNRVQATAEARKRKLVS
jgi:DNA-binding NarL/FixJ family response regulator